jgi:hypothetical protein
MLEETAVLHRQTHRMEQMRLLREHAASSGALAAALHEADHTAELTARTLAQRNAEAARLASEYATAAVGVRLLCTEISRCDGSIEDAESASHMSLSALQWQLRAAKEGRAHEAARADELSEQLADERNKCKCRQQEVCAFAPCLRA